MSSHTISMLFGISMIIYILSFLIFLIFIVNKKKIFGLSGHIVAILGFIIETIAIIMRWYLSYKLGIGHAPLSNMYESMIFFTWALLLLYIIFEKKYELRKIGAFISLLNAISIAITSLFLSDEIQPLIPALQSNWLIAHVFTSFIGYACFAIGFISSIVYLFVYKKDKSSNFFNKKILENLSYKSILIGFIFLSLGIIAGAIWANYAWGTYWSWDPKETWSLITWLIYATYLHARFTIGWNAKKLSILSIIGFLCVIFTYWGVNYLLPGLHSYG